jgi:hypothetical protein
MSRLVALTFELLLLGGCFLVSAAVSSYACSVTNRTIIESSLDDCSPPSGAIYKLETNRITFSDGDFDNVEAYGLGHCGSPSVSGTFTKCYPEFNTPTTGNCTPSSCNCVRWSQFVRNKIEDCGFFPAAVNTVELIILFFWKRSVGTKAVEVVGAAHPSVWQQAKPAATIRSVAMASALTGGVGTEKSGQGAPF